MTATITSIAQGFDVGARTYCFHARTSTVAAGSLWTAQSVWWFVSQAGVVTKRHHGLELIHTSTYNGEQIDLRIVDEDGTEEWATPVTTTVGSTYDFTAYVSSSGNDSNDGLSSGAPKLTIAAALDVIRSNWVTDGEMLLSIASGSTFTIGATTGNVVWNHCTTAGGSTDLDGRLTIRGIGTQATISLTATNVGLVSMSGLRHGLVLWNVNAQGPYTVGGAAHTADLITHIVPGTGGLGHNLAIIDCTIGGTRSAIIHPNSGISVAEVANGSFDWLSLENVTFTDVAEYGMFGDEMRYVGLYNVDFNASNGDSTGSMWRYGRIQYCSLTTVTWDKTGDAWQANLWRLNGGITGSGQDISRYISLHDCHMVGVLEGFEIDQPNSTDDRYVSDVWFHNCSWDPATVVTTGAMVGVNNGGGSVGQDITRLRVTNCWGRCNTYNTFFTIQTNGSSTTPKIHSVMLDQNTWYQDEAQGFFTSSAVFLQCSGNTANYDSSSLTIVSNYAYCDTANGASSPASFMALVAASHVATSDYNVCCKTGSSNLTWNGADSLATWQGATVHDDNSFEVVSASHNLTNVTAGSFDAEPAADGTPSASLPQVRRGFPGWGFADADSYLRDGSLPDAGSHEYGSGTLMDDPSFGGAATGPAAARWRNTPFSPHRLRGFF